MAGILNKSQSDEIKKIKQVIHQLDIDGWMCEGHDVGLNQFFNNDLENGFFIADYDGNVISADLEVSDDLKEFARLNGEICRICGYPEKEEDYER